jgi:alpha-galactosidase
MMLCSGGGRTDYGALPYFTEFWPSDNTDPLERVYIQWGYSFFFPANTIAAHITNSGKQTLKFKTDVAMMDKLGYDIRVDQFTPEELQFSREALKTYQRIHDVIWYGDLYRLESPWQSNRAVLLYVTVNKDRSILFDYHLNSRRQDIFNRVALQGLDPKKNYHIREINLFPGTKSQQPDNDKVFSGDYLMTIGWNPSRGRNTPLSSFVYELTAE